MKPELIAGYGPGLSEAEDAMRECCMPPQKDPTTGLVFSPDGWLRVVVKRGRGMLRVNLQSIDTGRIIGTATGNGVEETLSRIIKPSERNEVREVVFDYHTLGAEFTQPDTTDGIKVDIKPEVGTFDADKFDIWTGKPKDDGVTIQYRGEQKKVSIEEAMRLQQEKEMHSAPTIKHSHYKKDISNLSMLDIYRVLSLFEVRSHAVGHAIKKLIMAGKRGSKGYEQDIREAVDSLNRELQMIAEDGK